MSDTDKMEGQEGYSDALAVAREAIPKGSGNVIELRTLKPYPRSFYVGDAETMAREAIRLSEDEEITGVFRSLNPVNGAAERLEITSEMLDSGPVFKKGPGSAARDSDVLRRQSLLIDIDAIRSPDTNATDEELAHADDVASPIADYFDSQGVASPERSMSGNGYHLVLRYDAPGDDGGAAKDLLYALALKFNTEHASVDLSVHNPSRITKVPGTQTRKGPHTEERPHRRARLISPHGEGPPLTPDDLRYMIDDLTGGAGAKSVAALPLSPVGPGAPAQLGAPLGTKPRMEPDTVLALLMCIAIERPGYDLWLRLASAVLEANGGNIQLSAEMLKQKWPEEKPGEYDRILSSPLSRITRGTLVAYARLNGYQAPGETEGEALQARYRAMQQFGLPLPQEAAEAEPSPSKPKTIVDRILAVATDHRLILSEEGQAFAQIREHDPVYEVDGARYKRLLKYAFYQQYKNIALNAVPPKDAVDQAIGQLAAIAQFDSGGDGHAPKRHKVWNRVAAVYEGSVLKTWILDLADEQGRYVKIEAGSEPRVVTSLPSGVFMRRLHSQLPLPVPDFTGTLADVLPEVRTATLGDRARLLAFLISALHPLGPYIVLSVEGPAGTGKSILCELIARLLDNRRPLTKIGFGAVSDMIAHALNRRILVWDNISELGALISDVLCAIAVGVGLGSRKLYTNNEEQIVNVCRPIVLNGISKFVKRADLQSRTLSITLAGFSGKVKRKRKTVIESEFEKGWPKALGGLVNAVAEAMKRPDHEPDQLPRMADAAAWVDATNEVWPEGVPTFIESLKGFELERVQDHYDSNPFIRHMVDGVRAECAAGPWRTTLPTLIERFEPGHAYASSEWPSNAKAMKDRISRHDRILRLFGVSVEAESVDGNPVLHPKSRRRMYTASYDPESDVTRNASDASFASEEELAAQEDARAQELLREMGDPFASATPALPTFEEIDYPGPFHPEGLEGLAPDAFDPEGAPTDLDDTERLEGSEG